jgi:hypothetical protein
MKIYWMPVPDNQEKYWEWKELAWFEPEPVLKHMVSERGERNKDTSFLRCPAFIDYYKNTFLMRAPVDLTITLGEDGHLQTQQYDQDFYNFHVTERFEPGDKHITISVEFMNIFLSEESVLMQQLPAVLEHNESLKNIHLIGGQFDISKWVRPLTFAFEIHDITKGVHIKRGDPLYYIKFVTDEKVELVRQELTPELVKVYSGCTRLKEFIPNNTMEQNYGLLAPYLKVVKDKLFPKRSKCPFSKFFK